MATWQAVTVHPDAVLEPTYEGRKLGAIESFNGKIYAGYGDANASTSSVKIRAYDPELKTWTQSRVVFRTEQVKRFRSYGGKLYAVDDDPISNSRGGWASGGIDPSEPTNELWVTRFDHVDIMHSYDLARLGDKILVAGISRGGRCSLFVSPEVGGQSSTLWTGSSSAGPLRSIGVLNGSAYWASPDDRTSGRLFRYDGRVVVKDGPAFAHPAGATASFDHWTEFKERLLTISYGRIQSTNGVSPLAAIPAQPTTRGYSAFKITTTANRIYTMYRGRPSLVRQPNGSFRVTYPNARVYHKLGISGTPVFLAANLPANAESIAILGDQIYAGGVEGQLYCYSDPIPV